MTHLLTTFALLLLPLGFVQAGHSIELERTELEVKLPKAISDHTATLGSDNLIYVAGGCDSPDGNVFDFNFSFFYCPTISSSFYAFDPTTQQFSMDLPDLPRPRYRHGAVAIQNHIFFVGGRDAEDVLIQEVDVFDVTTKAWATIALPAGYATSDLAGWGTETHAYFAGGYDQNYTAMANVFSIELDTFQETGEPEIKNHKPLLTPRGDIAATVNLEKGYAYVSGGFSHENDFCQPIASVERYSLLGDTWIDVASLPTARADKAMVTLGGHTLSMGGERQVENKCELDKPSPGELTVAVDDIEVLNDDDSTWDTLDPLPEHRFRFAAVVFEHTIYTFGGQQAYDEACNCLKTVDEVVSYVDKTPTESEDENQDSGHGEDGHAHEHEHEQEEQGATTDGTDEVSTADDQPSARTLSPARPRMVGLGLALERNDRDRTTYVQEIIRGFAAHKSGQFQEHDVVVAVDQEPIEGWNLDAIKQLTVGEEGSFCTLQMLRGDRYFSVTLQRISPDRFEGSARYSYQ